MKKILIYLIINLIIFNGCDVESVKENIKPTPPVLSAPSNNATNINIDAVLSWAASTDGNGDALKYNVYFGTENPPTIKVKELQNEISYTPTLKSNTTYYWKIEVNDGNGGVNVSEIRSFKTLLALPTLPRLTAPDNNATNITLSPNLTWTASTTIGGYPIKYNVFLDTSSTALTSSTLTKKVSNMQTATSFTPTSLLSNTTYYWKIEANDGNGGVATSEISNFKTIVPPSVPVLTSPANLASDIRINTNLIWNASTSVSSNDIKYKVLLDTSSTFTSSVKVESTLQTSTSYTLTNLLSNKNYYWKVISVDGNGLMAESEVRNFKSTIIPPSVPSLISPLSDRIIESTTTTLSWSTSTSSSGYSVKYNVYLGTEKTSITKVSSMQPETTYTSLSLLKNTKYYWKIIANDGNGGITESAVDSFTVIIFDLVNVEGGTFTIGCTAEQGSDCESDENPSHSVTLSNFSIGNYEVTQAQWLSVMGSNPSYNNTCSDCPVEQVSWNDIQTFLTTLNTKTGKNYRLPTEAEWEYAARGGKKSNRYKYSGSNDIDSVAWYSGNSGSKTHVIGTTKKSNELGIYDMSGNVWEWCSDLYGSYTSASVSNPTGLSTGDYRVLRGGSWDNYARYARSSYRRSNNPNNGYHNDGFRLVLP